MAKKRRHLGEILYKAGLVKKEPLLKAIKTSKTSNRRLGEILLELGLVDEETLAKAIAKQFGLKYVDLDETEITPEVMELVPEELIKRHKVLPLGKSDGRLKLIISDPLDLDTMDTLRFRLNAELDYSLASLSKINSYIDDSVNEADKAESDRLKHSIDATAAELSEAGHELQAEAVAAPVLGDPGIGHVLREFDLEHHVVSVPSDRDLRDIERALRVVASRRIRDLAAPIVVLFGIEESQRVSG